MADGSETIPSGDDDTAPARPGAVTRATPPRTMGRYQLGRRLGAGGMGQVFEAHDPQLNRTVAVKLLHTGGGSSGSGAELQQRLLREAQAMARLSHPNLAVVHDVGVADGEVFIAMELLPGGTLKQWAQSARPWRARLDAIVAAGRGLAAAHAAGLVHRDFKPDNVLIAGDGAMKVVDFGLARGVGEAVAAGAPASGDDVLATPLTATGAVMGTPAYMAPEQHGGEVADARADQFSFAVAAFEVLHGHRPFVPTPALAFARGTGIAGPLRAEVPAGVTDVLRRALEGDPERRWPSMTALLDALVAAAAPRARRWPWLVVAAVAVGGAVAVWWTQRGGGAVPPDEVARVIAAHQLDVDRCRLDAARVAPRGGGAIALALTVGADGQVTGVDVVGDPRAPGATCLVGAAMRWSFAAGDDGRTAAVRVELPTIAAPRVRAVAPDHYRLARATVAQWVQDPSPLFAARLVSTTEQGRPIGMKLFAVGADLAALGLMNGDTVMSVDGRALDNAALTDAAWGATLATGPRVEIVLRRRGEVHTLVYEFVDGEP